MVHRSLMTYHDYADELNTAKHIYNHPIEPDLGILNDSLKDSLKVDNDE